MMIHCENGYVVDGNAAGHAGVSHIKCRRIADLQAQLAKHCWIPVSEMPENLRERPTTEAWETYYFILEESSAMPQVMRADEIWLNEGSNVEFYSHLPPLPKEKSDVV